MSQSVGPFDAPPRGTLSPFVGKFDTVSAALEVLRSLPSPRGQLDPSGGEINNRLPTPHAAVHVRNDTGAALDVLSIVKLGETVESITANPHGIFRLPVCEGTTPDSASNQFAVLMEPCGVKSDGNGKVAVAAIRGFAVCYVNVVSTADLWASPTAGSTAYLTSGDSGPARILSTPTGTGVQLCAVLIDDRGDRLARVVVDETTMNGEPATTLTLYAADNPDANTPYVQWVVANNYSAGNPGVQYVVYPLGSAGDAAYTQTFTTNSSETTQVVNQYSVNNETADVTITASGGVQLHTLSSNQTWNASAATMTGFSSGGVLVHSSNNTNVSSIDVTGLTGYEWYQIVMSGFSTTTAGGSALYLRTSTDGGSSYDTTGYVNSNSAATNGFTIVASTIPDDDSVENGVGCTFILYYPADATNHKFATWQASGYSNDSASQVGGSAIGKRSTTSAVNAIRLITAAGNVNGRLRIYGFN